MKKFIVNILKWVFYQDKEDVMDYLFIYLLSLFAITATWAFIFVLVQAL